VKAPTWTLGLLAALCAVLVGLAAKTVLFPTPHGDDYHVLAGWGASDGVPDSAPENAFGPAPDAPIGIAIAGDEIFVSDSGRHRIEVFGRDGRPRRTFGSRGEGAGHLDRPMHIDIRNDRLYVAEYLNDRIQIFSLAGESLALIGGPGSGAAKFDAAAGVAVDSDGRLYVADFYNQRVQLLDADGEFIRQWGKTGEKGRFNGRFNYPTDLALGPDGRLVVADAYNNRLQLFADDGSLERYIGGLFGLPGRFPAWFRVATGIDVGPRGRIYVADFYNSRIQVFSAGGRLESIIGGPSSGPGEFDRPTDVAVDERGTVYVTDFGNHRIQAFAPEP